MFGTRLCNRPLVDHEQVDGRRPSEFRTGQSGSIELVLSLTGRHEVGLISPLAHKHARSGFLRAAPH